MSEEKVYSLTIEQLSEEIAKYEYTGDNLIAHGLHIAATLAGIDIASPEFDKAISRQMKKIIRNKNKRNIS